MRQKFFILALLLPAFINAQQSASTFIQKGSEWKYYDKPSYPGDDWMKDKFNDGGWKSGRAELGYGDGDEKTVISHGGKEDSKHLTAYFRKTFEVSDLEKYKTVELKIKRDDGAIVFINGNEVFRTNMPRGKIKMETQALSALSGGNESMYVSKFLEKSMLKNGMNFIAVEIHQDNPGSSDLSFDLSLEADMKTAVIRGPYLQSPSPGSMIVRWRTSTPTIAKISFGKTINYRDSLTENEPATDHSIQLTGLTPNTKYYYSVSAADESVIADSSFYFITPPAKDASLPVRIWTMGDFGSTGNDQIAARDAYYSYSGNTYTNLLLWLGDDAYPSGTDEQYSTNVFTPYAKILAQSPVYSTSGNHDLYNSNVLNETGPYFDIFSFPKNGECGGVKSGSEAYYSFDYGDIHFICLESNVDSFKTRLDEMVRWLKEDLEANKSRWTIAYFHYAPYSKGYHNSDNNKIMIWMRENIVPILEEHQTDLVLSGHLHDYERTFLMNGHYGLSSTLNKSMIVDRGKGADPVVYTKKTKGTMYIIAGCMGETQPVSKNWPHPANAKSYQKITGSLVLDISNEKIEGRLITKDGKTGDHFVIEKK